MASAWMVVMLVVAAPAALSALLALTAMVESRLIAPDERAEKVHDALVAHREPKEVEELVVTLAEQALPAERGRRPEGLTGEVLSR